MQAAKSITNHPKSEANKNAPGSSFFFQPKPSINKPGDQYEQEADAMVDKVMRMKNLPAKPFFTPANYSTFSGTGRNINVQRKCKACEEEETKMQRKEMNNEPAIADSSTENYIGSLQGKGKSLSQQERSFFEPRFGYNFSDIQLHTNEEAHQSAKNINALAYTHGSHIVFASSQYQPHTDAGKKLIAHEPTHVIQQNAGMATKKIQRDRDPAFSVEGLFEDRVSLSNFIFFDLNKPDNNAAPENDLDTAERNKIGNFATTHFGGITLFGFASEEGVEAGNSSLITKRIQAVQNILASPAVGYDPALITTQAMPATSRNHFDYRFWRTVEMEATGQSSSRVQPPSVSASRGLEACSADQQNNIVIPARNRAVDNMNDTITAVNQFRINRTANVQTGNALRSVFHSDADTTAQQVVERLTANVRFLGSIIPILHCGTSQSVDCGGTAEALTNSTSITLCLPFFDTSLTTDQRSSTLVHESSHGSRLNLNDRAYRRERVISILTTRQALDNAEFIAIFVETVKSDTAPSVGPTDADTTNGCGTDEEMAKAAIAWAERWNTYAVFGLQQTYGNDENTRFMAPHINFFFGRSDRSALAGMLDRYTQMMNFFDSGAITIECVDQTDPLYNTWKIAQWSTAGRSVKISNRQLHQSYLNADDRVKYIYGALAVDRFGVPESQRMAYPNVARAYKIFFWGVEG